MTVGVSGVCGAERWGRVVCVCVCVKQGDVCVCVCVCVHGGEEFTTGTTLDCGSASPTKTLSPSTCNGGGHAVSAGNMRLRPSQHQRRH